MITSMGDVMGAKIVVVPAAIEPWEGYAKRNPPGWDVLADQTLVAQIMAICDGRYWVWQVVRGNSAGVCFATTVTDPATSKDDALTSCLAHVVAQVGASQAPTVHGPESGRATDPAPEPVAPSPMSAVAPPVSAVVSTPVPTVPTVRKRLVVKRG